MSLPAYCLSLLHPMSCVAARFISQSIGLDTFPGWQTSHDSTWLRQTFKTPNPKSLLSWYPPCLLLRSSQLYLCFPDLVFFSPLCSSFCLGCAFLLHYQMGQQYKGFSNVTFSRKLLLSCCLWNPPPPGLCLYLLLAFVTILELPSLVHQLLKGRIHVDYRFFLTLAPGTLLVLSIYLLVLKSDF